MPANLKFWSRVHDQHNLQNYLGWVPTSKLFGGSPQGSHWAFNSFCFTISWDPCSWGGWRLWGQGLETILLLKTTISNSFGDSTTQKPLVLQRNVVEILIFASVFKELKGLITKNTTFYRHLYWNLNKTLCFSAFSSRTCWDGLAEGVRAIIWGVSRETPRNYLGGWGDPPPK